MGDSSLESQVELTDMSSSHGYHCSEDSGSLPAQLKWRKKCIDALTKEEFKYACTKRPLAHFYCALRSYALCFITGFLIWKYQDNPLCWVPLGYLQGSWLVALVFLQHEGVHSLIFNDTAKSSWKKSVTMWCARFYAVPVFVPPSFFQTYHLRHHHQFFQGTDDPKSTHFVPRDGKRWTKLLFFGPGLIKIFTALRFEVAKTMTTRNWTVAQRESNLTRLIHLAVSYYLISTYSWAWWLKIHALPHVFWFPVCFMINRCGQHYCCNPKDSALHSTITIGNLFWDWAHNYSEYHVEHHTFGEVPCYNLKYLHDRLAPRLYKKMNIPRFYFKDLVWGWLVQNRPVYTVWYDMAIPW